MRTIYIAGSLALAASLLVGANDATAQAAACVITPVKDATEALSQVSKLDRDDCLGGQACTSEICATAKKFFDIKSTPAPSQEPTPAQVSAILYQILAHAEPLRATEQGHRLTQRMAATLADFERDRTTAASAWTIQNLAYFTGEPEPIDIKTWISGCTGPSDCGTTAAQARKTIELATLFKRVLTKADQENVDAFAAQLDLLDTRWRAYLGSARGQYPWELALNSARYQKTAQFDAPPTSQWILAHPGAGYELTRKSNSQQPSESLLLELAGLYRWNWSEGKMVQRWGGSITLAWRDSGDERTKLGYGVLFYLPRQSTAGYVYRPQKNGSDEHALVLSADLVKFIRGTGGIKERLLGVR